MNNERQRNHVRHVVRSVLSSHYEIEEEVRDPRLGDSFLVREASGVDTTRQPEGLGNSEDIDSWPRAEFESAEPTVKRSGIVHVGPLRNGLAISLNLFEATPPSHGPDDPVIQPLSFTEYGHTASPLFDPSTNSQFDLAAVPGDQPSQARATTAEHDLLDEIHSRLRLGLCPESCCDPTWMNRWQNFTTRVYRDHEHFYSRESLSLFGVGLGVAAILANSQADRDISDAYQEEIRGGSTDEAARIFKQFGDGTKTFPVFAGAIIYGTLAGRACGAEEVGEWGWRCVRTFAVGGPPLLLIQRVTGADRPDMSTHDSRWIPFRAEKGASGHAFMGAIPFITAAKMTDEPWLKAGFYLGSTLTGWSRLNDHDHYFSQIMLGWLVAYVAASAVDETEFEVRSYQIIALPMADGMGLGIEFRR